MALTPEQQSEIELRVAMTKALAEVNATTQNDAALELTKAQNEAALALTKAQNEAALALTKAQKEVAKEQSDATALENSKQRRVQLINVAHATLLENKRYLPIEQRQITPEEIITLANSLESHVNS